MPATTGAITDSQRDVLAASSACEIVTAEAAAAAFERTPAESMVRPGECKFALSPGLAGSDRLIVSAFWIAGDPDYDPATLYEERTQRDDMIDVDGLGVPAVFDTWTLTLWILTEPAQARLPGRGAELGDVPEAVLTLQVLLPPPGDPEAAVDDALEGLRRLAEMVLPAS